jgi:hypothetical protein
VEAAAMSYRTTLALLLTVCLLGAALWVMQRNVQSTDRRLAQAERVLDLDLLHVDSLVVQHDDEAIEVERRGSGWWIVRPIEARADEASIAQLLSASEALVCAETITRDQRQHRALSLGDYGLDIPRTSVTYRTPLGTRRLLVGNDAHLGQRTYVRIDGQADVMLAEGALREALPESLEAMRDRELLHGQAARVTRLEIERPDGGFVQLLRGPSGWTVQQPVREPADTVAVNALLDALFAARIERFVWDPPVGVTAVAADAAPIVDAPAVPVESYGLAADTAPARLRIWQTGDDVGSELTLGKPVEAEGSFVYAMFTDSGSVFTLDTSLLERCQVPVDDLRSRDLVRLDPGRIRYLAVQQGDRKLTLGHTPKSGWSILEPIQWPADRETVIGVLRALTHARIQSFSDSVSTNTPPDQGAAALHITLDTVYPPELAGVAEEAEAGGIKKGWDANRCELVAVDNGSDDQMLVEVSGRIGRFHVRRDALVFLPEATALPFAFFDRSVLAVPPDHVQRIAVHRGEFEQVLERDTDGAWGTPEGVPGEPDALALSDVLFRVSNLRAMWVADQHPKELAPYGLDETDTSLTIGLTGGEAIQKTILIGSPAPPSGRYAMIQGHDIVFVLGQAVLDSLLRDLVAEPVEADAE